MNPSPDYTSMTEEEIVNALPTKVMGWEKRRSRDHRYAFHWGLPLADKEEWSFTAEEDWNPVSGSWDDTMMVVEKLRSIGVGVTLKMWETNVDSGSMGWANVWPVGSDEICVKMEGHPQRAICLAALAAFDSSPARENQIPPL